MADEIRDLSFKIVELENQLKELRAARQPVDLTAEEIRAYHKVRASIVADWGEECGINECQPGPVFVCACIKRCITKCINECVCGPCNICGWGGGGFGGGGRFGGLGG